MATRYFLYYIEGLKNAKSAKEKAIAAIGKSVEGATLTIRDVSGGPGQTGSGVIVAAVPKSASPAPAEIDKRLEYCADPARQVWMKANGFWIGYHVDLKPSADDLRREVMVGGYRHDCPESGSWTIPLARKTDGTTLFDQRIVYQPDGTIAKEPLTRYKALCDFAADHWEMLTGLDPTDSGVEFEADQRYCDVACDAIGVNYHAGPYELTLLEALTMSSAAYICGYLCDWPGLVAILEAKAASGKKNKETDDTLTTNSGAAVA
jgi:hypothetical protein